MSTYQDLKVSLFSKSGTIFTCSLFFWLVAKTHSQFKKVKLTNNQSVYSRSEVGGRDVIAQMQIQVFLHE